jgi:hypothetical protein
VNKLILAGLIALLLITSVTAQELAKPWLLPDNPFYPFQRVIERIQLMLTFDPEAKARLHLQFAERRLAELNEEIAKNQTQYMKGLYNDYEIEINETGKEVNATKGLGRNVTELAEHVSNATYKHVLVLERVLEKVPDQAKPSIEHAINVSINGHEQAVESIWGRINKTIEKVERNNCTTDDDCNNLICPQVLGGDTPLCEDGKCRCGERGEKGGCPKILCVWDPCPGSHLPDSRGCLSCASPCSNCCPPCPEGAACAPCPPGWPPCTTTTTTEPGPIPHDCFIACPNGTRVECGQKCSNFSCNASIQGLDCPFGMRCENSTCVDVGCVKEGGTIPGAISPDYRNHMATKCCEGLERIAYSGYYNENCRPAPLAGAPAGVCSKCGNGVCESWETKCTCKEDCETKTCPQYTCPNGIKVPWCVLEKDKCVCIISPENQCTS